MVINSSTIFHVGQAPAQGLASSVYKQIADGPVQVRKLIQTLSAEIQATKKAAKVIWKILIIVTFFTIFGSFEFYNIPFYLGTSCP